MSNKLLIPLLIATIVSAVALVVYSVRSSLRHPSDKVSYPYVCKGCGAIFDVSELKKKPGMWRTPAGAPSDSVVTCIKCNKGWAFPVAKCEKCGTEYILYLCPVSRCPVCDLKAAAAAKKAGVDTVFKRPG